MSFVLHVVILFLIARFGVQWVLGGGDDRFGTRGGGGGAGGSAHMIDLPAASAPAPAAARTVEQLPKPTVPPPDPLPTPTLTPPTLAPLATMVAPVVASTGATGDGTTGAGPGTGGGTGTGTGTGVGNDSGPGSGGNGGYIAPSPRVVLLPAECARGKYSVLFSVTADGHVARVTVDPPPKDAGCRRKMQDKLMGYEFVPARTRDGRAVADTFRVTWQQ